MRYPRTKNPVACAGKPTDRWAPTGAALVQYNGQDYIAATDGKILSLVECDREETDEPSGMIPAAAFAEAKRGARAGTARLLLNGTATVPDSGASFALEERRFPDVCDVIPKGPVLARVSIDVKRLATLAKALGAESVSLEIHDWDGKGEPKHPATPIVVRPLFVSGGFGVIMPLAAI